jgi:hypothetical protein
VEEPCGEKANICSSLWKQKSSMFASHELRCAAPTDATYEITFHKCNLEPRRGKYDIRVSPPCPTLLTSQPSHTTPSCMFPCLVSRHTQALHTAQRKIGARLTTQQSVRCASMLPITASAQNCAPARDGEQTMRATKSHHQHSRQQEGRDDVGRERVPGQVTHELVVLPS